MKPVRIQRSRKEKQSVKAKYCGRPGKYGNPFKVGDYVGAEWYPKLEMHDQENYIVYNQKIKSAKEAIYLFKKYQLPKLDLTELKNQTHLSCWCGLDNPCHVDAIIEAI